MVTGFSAVNAALRFQIENCLSRAERFMENPREVIMDARRNGGNPAGMIGAVAYGLEGINPPAGRAARHRRRGDREHRDNRHS